VNDGRLLIHRWSPYVVFFTIALLMLLRAPSLVTDPRFWAEEGRVYFARAYNTEWFKSILLPYGGYYSLMPNSFCLIAAKWVPLERAPLVTTLAAFVVQLLPHLLILFGMKPVLPRFSERVLLSCVVLFVMQTGAIFLSTITSQYHLAVVTYLILISIDAQSSKPWVWLRRFLVVLSGLTGAVSCFLLPLFLLKAYLTRRRDILVLAGLLLAATLVQVGVFVAAASKQLPGRPGPASPRQFASALVEQDLVWPVLGYRWPVSGYRHEQGPAPSGAGRYAIGLAILLTALATAIASPRRRDLAIILAAFCLVAALSASASIRGAGGPRYVYVPAVILVSFFVRSVYVHRPSLRSLRWLASLAVLMCSLAAWVPQYWESMSGWVVKTWPSWSQEVAIWRETPNYRIKIWPQGKAGKWVVDLRTSPPPTGTRQRGR
jgi:hypothetical protein